MKAAELLAMYVRVADAPDAVEKLRRFVLELAVRGALVEQDSSEHASDLILEVRREKERSGRRPSSTSDNPINQIPFEIPQNWMWLRLKDLALKLTDGTHHSPVNSESGEFKYVTAKNIKETGVSLQNVTFVTREVHEEIFARCNPEYGDILYVKDGATTGVATINDLREPFSLLSSVALIKLPQCVSNRLVLTFLRSAFFLNQMRGFMKGAAIPRVTLTRMAPALIPLPPLAEQHRIVAKVDELMALCDQLEAARKEREAARDRLAAASLTRLNAPDPDTFQADARFALHVLPALSARADQVKQLRQTILNLAVRGKLAAQESGESLDSFPAELLETLGEELPSTWGWVKLEHLLAEETRNGYSRKPDDAPDGVPILRISAGTVRRDGIVAEEEHKLISGIDEVTRRQYGIDAGDLLACRFNGNKAFVGRLTLFTDYLKVRPIYPDKLIRVRVNKRLALPAYVRLAADSDLVRAEVERLCATTVGNWGISASNLKAVRIPLPPLAEQRRVVNRVNALMSLCEQLETSLSDGEAARNSLLDALLNDALRSAEGDEIPSPDAFEATPAKAVRESPLHTRPSRSC